MKWPNFRSRRGVWVYAGIILSVGSDCFAIGAPDTPNPATGHTWPVLLLAKHGGGFRYFTPLACIAIWAALIIGIALILFAPKADQNRLKP